MAAEVITLDLDGTVWDSRPWYAETIAQLSDASVSKIRSKLDAGDSIVKVAREHGVKMAQLICAAKEDGASIKFYEGVLSTLVELQARDIPIGIVTNLSGRLVRPLLASTGIGEFAAAVVTPGGRVPAKPNPSGIHRVLKEMGVQQANQKIWFVGDDNVDAKAAKAASVQFAWASFGYEKQKPPSVDKVLTSFREVLDL